MNEVEFLKNQVKKYNLDSKHRYRNYTYKRFYIMYRLHKCKLTLVEIGKIVITIESCNNINVKIQIPNRFDKDYKFDKYMTIKEIIKELAKII
jgi:hypothetical protein